MLEIQVEHEIHHEVGPNAADQAVAAEAGRALLFSPELKLANRGLHQVRMPSTGHRPSHALWEDSDAPEQDLHGTLALSRQSAKVGMVSALTSGLDKEPSVQKDLEVVLRTKFNQKLHAPPGQ